MNKRDAIKKERETALKQLSRANCHRTEHTPIARKMFFTEYALPTAGAT